MKENDETPHESFIFAPKPSSISMVLLKLLWHQWYRVPGQDKVTRSYVHGGLWGLARTFRMEERNVSLRSEPLG
jgi:hypothetical protein